MTRHIIVMGASGCGKSSVGRALAERLGWTFIEGDDFHPASNIRKMSAGQPLTDDDRWPWLDLLHQEMRTAARQHRSTVLSCSALRQVYRDRLTQGLPGTQFIYLRGDRTTLLVHLNRRSGHFMKADLLDSQLAVLEEPTDALVFPCHQAIGEIADAAAALLRHPHESTST